MCVCFASDAFLCVHTNGLETVTYENICDYHLGWDSSVAVYIEQVHLPKICTERLDNQCCLYFEKKNLLSFF